MDEGDGRAGFVPDMVAVAALEMCVQAILVPGRMRTNLKQLDPSYRRSIAHASTVRPLAFSTASSLLTSTTDLPAL